MTGGPAPNGPSPVTSPYSITVAGQQAEVSYIGLSPGFVGLYQANFKIPPVASGNYPISITINGVQSNKPVISVAD